MSPSADGSASAPPFAPAPLAPNAVPWPRRLLSGASLVAVIVLAGTVVAVLVALTALMVAFLVARAFG